ncbi:MAG: CBS and ACT domain-containing protein [Anaerolineae bacterium]
MFVRDRMSSEPITITHDTPFQDALKLMREQRFRRLPVVDKNGELVGLVSERDLLYASPSPATSLSVWELNYLLSKLQVREIMTKNVITTTPDTPIEDAARLIADNKIGGMPVVDEDNHVVGVITETDIFKTFVEMLGGGQSGLRLTLKVPERKGVLADLSRAIFDLGGNIVSVGSFYGEAPGERELVVKVRDVRRDQLVETLEALGDHVIDAREV